MGQKVSPVGLRIGVNKDWQSKWYAEKDFAVFQSRLIPTNYQILGVRTPIMRKIAKASLPYLND